MSVMMEVSAHIDFSAAAWLLTAGRVQLRVWGLRKFAAENVVRSGGARLACRFLQHRDVGAGCLDRVYRNSLNNLAAGGFVTGRAKEAISRARAMDVRPPKMKVVGPVMTCAAFQPRVKTRTDKLRNPTECHATSSAQAD